MKQESRLITSLVTCNECSFSNEATDEKEARKIAKKHVNTHGHEVSIQLSYILMPKYKITSVDIEGKK